MYHLHRAILPHCLLRSLIDANANIELCGCFLSFFLFRKNVANIERNFKISRFSGIFLFFHKSE